MSPSEAPQSAMRCDSAVTQSNPTYSNPPRVARHLVEDRFSRNERYNAQSQDSVRVRSKPEFALRWASLFVAFAGMREMFAKHKLQCPHESPTGQAED